MMYNIIQELEDALNENGCKLLDDGLIIFTRAQKSTNML